MSKTICVTIVKTITIEDEDLLRLSDEELIQEYEDEYSLDDRFWDDWFWDDSSYTVEVFNTEDEINSDGTCWNCENTQDVSVV